MARSVLVLIETDSIPDEHFRPLQLPGGVIVNVYPFEVRCLEPHCWSRRHGAKGALIARLKLQKLHHGICYLVEQQCLKSGCDCVHHVVAAANLAHVQCSRSSFVARYRWTPYLKKLTRITRRG